MSRVFISDFCGTMSWHVVSGNILGNKTQIGVVVVPLVVVIVCTIVPILAVVVVVVAVVI